MPLTKRSRGVAASSMFLVMSAVLLVAAACGGGGSESDDAPAADSGQKTLAGYVDCMNKNGVPLNLPTAFPSERPFPRFSGRPDARLSPRPSRQPGSGLRDGEFGRPAGVDDATWQQALQTCRPLLPSLGPSRLPGGGTNLGALTAYRNCLQDHGVTLSNGGLRELMNTADPKIAAAVKACAPLRPALGPNAAPSPTS